VINTFLFKKALIIADDLSGANDTVAQFAKLAIPSITVTIPAYINSTFLKALAENYDVIALNTDSRHLDGMEAYNVLLKVGKEIRKSFEDLDDVLVYKKIDSTLRGNITEEIIAIRDHLEPKLIVFTPAYPKQGRITVNGIHLVRGVPVDQTQFGRDVRKPVKTSNISAYFADVFGKSYKHVYLNELQQGRLIEYVNNYRILSFDVENEGNLRTIVETIMSKQKNVLWVGSAGLAEYVAYTAIIGATKGRPILNVIGSLNEVTRNQVKELLSALKCKLILIDINNLLENLEGEYARVESEVRKSLEDGSEIIIATGYTNEQVEQSKAYAEKRGVPLTEIGSLISNKLGKLACSILNNVSIERFSGVFVSGGDTALALIKELNVNAVSVVGEIEPGLPLLRYGKTYIVTKAGGFGSEHTLIRVVTRLKSLGGTRGES